MMDTTRRWSIPSLGIRNGTLLTITNRRAVGTGYLAQFLASNNEAEYEAILIGLSLVVTLSASKLEICSDS